MVNYNGEIMSPEDLGISHENRSFRYGDGVFESIRYSSGKLFFWEDHYFRLMADMRILRMDIPMEWSPEFIEEQIKETISANHWEKLSLRVRFTVFRNEGGKYAPKTNSVSFIVEVERLDEEGGYQLNENGLVIDLFKDYTKQKGLLGNVKSANALLYVIAGVFQNENELDECVLINDDKMVVEAISSNLFLVKGKQLITPTLDSGCLKGVIRGRILKHAKQWGFEAIEEDFSPFEIQRAEEVFLTNAIRGIQWVKSYRRKEFKNEISGELIRKLSIQANLE
ncbi:MAG: aminotransferase class IV [Bacteroidota bacterium]|nr:aminotransferase class IV [Bacteroidota bacterium]MDX5428744.1 aminotransferase class IV [Bacteroidota bacterium]MDX5506470.1 aminotransferase class IV [Bacteroidota bacterium]